MFTDNTHCRRAMIYARSSDTRLANASDGRNYIESEACLSKFELFKPTSLKIVTFWDKIADTSPSPEPAGM